MGCFYWAWAHRHAKGKSGGSESYVTLATFTFSIPDFGLFYAKSGIGEVCSSGVDNRFGVPHLVGEICTVLVPKNTK